MTDDDKKTSIRRFAGVDEDGKERIRWVRWAKSHLYSSNLQPQAYANRLLSLLDGAAERACEYLEPDDLLVAGAETLIFDALERRFPAQEIADKTRESMTNLLRLRPERSERPESSRLQTPLGPAIARTIALSCRWCT